MVSSTPATKQPMSSNNLIVVMLLVTFLTLGLTAFAGKALYSTITLDAKVVAKKKTADDRLKKDVAAAPNLISAYNALGPNGAKLADALPNTSDFPSLIAMLENLGRDAGVTVKNIVPIITANETAASTTSTIVKTGGPGAKPEAKPFAFTTSITFSTYAALQTYLDHVEKSARPLRITDIKITGGGAMAAEVSYETYYQPASQLPFGEETVK